MTHVAIIPVLKQLIDVFDAVIRFFHDTFGFGWGLSIIALTVGVRILLLPLTIKQFRSMQAMQRLGPEMKKLQAKYKDDKQRLNQEMMKLYQTHQVNPFGSCLPLVAQMPVFISLFYMLRADLKLDICRDALVAAGKSTGSALQNTSCSEVSDGTAHQFLFIPDLTDSATGGVLVALIVLYIGSQLLSSVLMASATVDKNQRMLMIALPFVFTIFIINFPAGLLVYWITTNLWTVGQQFTLRKLSGDHSPIIPVDLPDGSEPAAMPGLFGKIMGKAAEQQKADAETKTGTKAGGAKATGAGKGSVKAPATKAVRTTAPPPPPRGKKKKRSGRRS
ncbi:MAG: YidC/Oxa1 family rane protein insertase [Solirubrobacterales bacterium]|jgi:YidC/Oxa1 family membrane protein insertase|nr:YidC/Oxa1 family rane protein insertase [Solirubrobacterales bacterium]